MLRKKPPVGLQWIHEVKFDGYHLQLHKEGKDVALLSKNGNDFSSRFPEMAIAAGALPTKSVILDCELTPCLDDGRPDFLGIAAQARGAAVCMGLRHLTHLGKDLRSLRLSARRMKLNKLMARVDSPMVSML